MLFKSLSPARNRKGPHQRYAGLVPAELAAAVALSALILWAPRGAAATLNGFEVSSALIPVTEIRSGGPPRDGIPSIDRPEFASADTADFLAAEDLVVSVTVEGVTRAYPLSILTRHEIVNDQVGDRLFAVTYCPLCGTAMVFNRRAGGRSRTFGVSGLLYQSALLMYDRETQSLWSQPAMKAVSGPAAGEPLEWWPSEQMTWAAWQAEHPEGQVLAEPGRGRPDAPDPYAAYRQSPETMFPVSIFRGELLPKAEIIGLLVNGTPKAYPLDKLASAGAVADAVGGTQIEVAYQPAHQRPRVLDRASGAPLPFVRAYWFAWQAFYPDTLLWQP